MAHKRPPDPRGGHIRIYWTMLDSNAWRALSYSSQSLYVALRRKLGATNNGNISATLGDLKHYGWNSSATLAKALRELVAAGFIAVTRQGGIAYGQKICTLYRFTDEGVFDHPKLGIRRHDASNDWQRFSNLAEAQCAVKASRNELLAQGEDNNLGLQKLKRISSRNEAKRQFNDSESEAITQSLVQKLRKGAHKQTSANPRPA